MPEARFLAEVLALCESHGVFAFHCYDSRKSAGKGFPDLVLTGCHQTLFVELKTPGGRFSRHQTTWKYRLIATGEKWAAWTPRDLKSGLIEETLSSL